MNFQYVRRVQLSLALGLAVVVAATAGVRADLSILPGWDYFETTEGTEFMGFDFQGEPLGTAYGNTDTIVRRLAAASVGAGGDTAAPIPIEMVALQLVSVTPINLGAGFDFHYVTLQSKRTVPGSPSMGTMTVTFNDDHVTAPDPPDGTGTFNSTINVAFDVRIGALDGPIINSQTLPLVSTGSTWGHRPDPDGVVIDGINHLLNTSTEHNDFFSGLVIEAHPAGQFAEHHAKPASHAVITTNSTLPPDTGLYRTREETHAVYGDDAAALKMAIKKPRHRPAPHVLNDVTVDGEDEIEYFFTQLSATVDILKAPNVPPEFLPLVDLPMRAEGFVTVKSYGKANQEVGTFQTEIIEMDLSGFVQTPMGPVPVQIQDLVLGLCGHS